MIKNQETQKQATAEAVDLNAMVRRCGQCLFAEGGGDKFEFSNGTTNYRYNCKLLTRKDNIVLLGNEEHFRWENQRACEHFEIATKTLRKREDLDTVKYDFICDGHFEIIKASA